MLYMQIPESIRECSWYQTWNTKCIVLTDTLIHHLFQDDKKSIMSTQYMGHEESIYMLMQSRYMDNDTCKEHGILPIRGMCIPYMGGGHDTCIPWDQRIYLRIHGLKAKDMCRFMVHDLFDIRIHPDTSEMISWWYTCLLPWCLHNTMVGCIQDEPKDHTDTTWSDLVMLLIKDHGIMEYSIQDIS